ncbi:Hypothetical protein PHPALM_19595 [Phytophthora palmivora]|uniref:Uncharacterized protein n=1 Tax=Phytophthora palmivora TaxID=4796 RepID=A0A2P4XH22_9STRA|nr:Hypothetical protein PHPALM_19595 [Phytophthora palmivora]
MHIARKEKQEVERSDIRRIEGKSPSSAFEMIAPKRVNIASLIYESWNEFTTKTVIADFANAGLLGDFRQFQNDQELPDVEEITALIS